MRGQKSEGDAVTELQKYCDRQKPPYKVELNARIFMT